MRGISALVAPETLGQRLRRVAKRAQLLNPWSPSRPYMLAVPPWQPSTAYLPYQTVVNGGNIYICVTGGTSAASGGPTNTTDGNSHTDGSAAWTWWGTNTVTSDPTLNQPAWTPSSAYSLGAQVINSGKVYACVGAGTSASSGGPSTVGASISDGTVTWSYLGAYKVSPYQTDFPILTYSSSLPGGLNNVYYNPTINNNYAATAAFVIAGGSGYAVGDTVTFTNASSGVSTVSTVLRVTSVSSGAVAAVSVVTAGNYTTLPTNPVTPTATSGSGVNATFTMTWTPPQWCQFRGFRPGGNQSSLYSRVVSYQGALGAALTGRDGAMEFYSDAPKFYFRLSNGNATGLCLVVDGVRYNMSALPNPGAANNYYTVDFSSTSGRKTRLWRIESTGSGWIPSVVAVDDASTIWAPDNTETVNVVAIGDSMLAGSAYGPFVPGNALTLRLGHELGWTVTNMGQGGTGWVNRGASPGTTTESFIFRIRQAVPLNPDVVLILGSTNDVNQPGISSAVSSGILSIRAALPSALIIVLGVWSKNDAAVPTVEAAIKSGVIAAQDTRTFFIPIYGDADGPWVSGSWNNNPMPNGFSNTHAVNSTLYIAGDSTHPSDQGISYLASRIVRAIMTTVLPAID